MVQAVLFCALTTRFNNGGVDNGRTGTFKYVYHDYNIYRNNNYCLLQMNCTISTEWQWGKYVNFSDVGSRSCESLQAHRVCM